MLALHGFHLVEVYNPHSNWRKDTQRWHELIRRGPKSRFGLLLLTIPYSEDLFNRGWIVVKTDGISKRLLKDALLRGSFYPSTGPTVVFGVIDELITVKLKGDNPAKIEFIAGNGDVVSSVTSIEASYTPKGNEGFVGGSRDRGGKRAWSPTILARARRSS